MKAVDHYIFPFENMRAVADQHSHNAS